MTNFGMFTLPDEYLQLREVVRDVCDRHIAPFAADVDERVRYPDEALRALNEAGLNAIHIPEGYGG